MKLRENVPEESFGRKSRQQMRKKRLYRLITFHTTHEAIAMEKYCGAHGIPGRLIPVPREISAGCGLAWRMMPEDYLAFRNQIDTNALKYEQVHELTM